MPTFSMPDVHRQRFAQQAEGKALYLVALHEGVPIGYVLLRFAPRIGEAALSYPESAYVEGLAVGDSWRRRGVATRLMEGLEETARDHRHPAVGLYVGIENEAAQALYKKLGYGPSKLPLYRVTWPTLNEADEVGEDGELCSFWIKSLEE